MKIRTFKARTFSEALALVKRELSEHAVILATRERKGLRPFVELTAAVDYDAESGPGGASGRAQALDQYRIAAAPAPKEPEQTAERTASDGRKGDFAYATDEVAPERTNSDDIRAEIRSLKEALEKMRSREGGPDIPEKKKTVLRYLAERSVREDLAAKLCEKAESVSDVPSLLSGEVEVRDRAALKKVTMLIGPTGVGKTTTIAKLAGKALKEGKKTGIVSLDTYRIGAIEQMRIYSRIMGIPLSIVSTAGELHRALLSLVQEREAVFVDTPGRNPSDEAYLTQLRKVCDTTVPMEVHLLMSATSDYEYMLESYKAYKRVPIDCVGFTKIDEAVRFGSLYNFLMAHHKPVSYVTTGQKVPDDIEFPTSDGFAQLILTKGCYRC